MAGLEAGHLITNLGSESGAHGKLLDYGCLPMGSGPPFSTLQSNKCKLKRLDLALDLTHLNLALDLGSGHWLERESLIIQSSELLKPDLTYD